MESPLASFSSNDELSIPGVYDVVRLIQKAGKDDKIKGIYLASGISSNGFAASEEIRNALLAFKMTQTMKEPDTAKSIIVEKILDFDQKVQRQLFSKSNPK